MNRLAPESLAAGRVQWQLFLTLTWSGQVPRPERRSKGVRLFLRRVAREARVPFERLVWLCREENGEATERPHFHLLMAGLPCSALGFDFGVRLGQLWEFGWLEGRLWVHGLGAVDYSCEEGANIYEGRKFRAGLPIMFSESLTGVVVPITGDNVEKDGAEHTVKSLSDRQALVQPDLALTSVVAEGAGYILAVNADRKTIRVYRGADVTGGCEKRF